MPLNRNERAHSLAYLLRQDYSGFATLIEKTRNLTREQRIRLLALVLKRQNGGGDDDLGVVEIIQLINGAS